MLVECEIRSGEGWEKIGIDDALPRRGEDMRCHSCGGRLRPHKECNTGSRAHFEHQVAHQGCSLKHPHPYPLT